MNVGSLLAWVLTTCYGNPRETPDRMVREITKNPAKESPVTLYTNLSNENLTEKYTVYVPVESQRPRWIFVDAVSDKQMRLSSAYRTTGHKQLYTTLLNVTQKNSSAACHFWRKDKECFLRVLLLHMLSAAYP